MANGREVGRERRRIANEIRDYLGGLAYPSTKPQIIRLVVAQNAPREVVDTLQRLPEETYSSIEDIMRHFGPKD